MKIQCLECKNEIDIEKENIKPGYYFECPYCAITMEIKEVKDDGSVTLTIIEEEK